MSVAAVVVDEKETRSWEIGSADWYHRACPGLDVRVKFTTGSRICEYHIPNTLNYYTGIKTRQ